ncbi:hypothetical protein JCM8208_003005 [Rhodotorula glutinis]
MAASSSAFLPSLVAAASIPAFSPSQQGGPSPSGFDSNASTSPGEGGAPSSSFFSSNRPHYGAPASFPPPPPRPLPPASSASFLPPIQPAPPRPSHPSSTSAPTRTGATFLSDEDDSTSEAGGGSTSAGLGAYAGPGMATPQGLQAIAPAPAGGRKPRAASVASSSGGNASSTTKGNKGKGRAADSDGTPAPPGAGAPVKGKKGGGKGGKRGQQVGPDGKPVPKKKKAGRACAACQKAHLTCDDARPCARCIKKGCPEECVDGARKKAKYLLEIPDELLERGRQAGGPSGTPGPSNGNAPQLAPEPSFLDSTLDSAMSDVGSHHQPSAPLAQADAQPFFDFGTSLSQPTSSIPASSAPATYDPTSFLSFAPAAPAVPDPQHQHQQHHQPTTTAVADATQFGSEAAGFEYAILNAMLNGNGFALDTHTTPALSGFGASGGGGPSGPEPGSSGGASRQPDPMLLDGGGDVQQQQQQQQQQQAQQGPPRAAFSSSPQPGGLLTAEEAYRSVTKPYPYAQSYHFLVKHLKERFEKNDILRIIRALATFRPSLIALQMPLTEEDETFVERTFQRTLVELNKLISFSGTPTVVWRRTGEICLVGTEFCLLTGWKREDLVGKKYIFELFDTASVVEYYESFAKHAFESTATSITMQCVVLAPDGRPVPCAFCFSVRRDLFSCPFLVIGSFLPVLV